MKKVSAPQLQHVLDEETCTVSHSNPQEPSKRLVLLLMLHLAQWAKQRQRLHQNGSSCTFSRYVSTINA